MKTFWLMIREIKERMGNRSYLLTSILAPLLVLFAVYLVLESGGRKTKQWKVLVADKGNLLSNKMAPREDEQLTYFFIADYVEVEEFNLADKYQEFDALLEVNEKVLSNKVGFVFYRELPVASVEKKVQYHLERRLEEVLLERYQSMPLAEYRQIKQPLTLSFRSAEDPHNERDSRKLWVGFFFGVLAIGFVGLNGITVMRSTVREKSSKVIEVLLGSIKPTQLLQAKILGVGLSSLLQFMIWLIIIGVGLQMMRAYLFPDYLQSVLQQQQLDGSSVQVPLYEYNEYVSLIFERTQYLPMLLAFLFVFIGGFLFYGGLFALMGASMGSEGDGQQFVIPLLLLVIFNLFLGYMCVADPSWLQNDYWHFIPFTTPMFAMIKLSNGISANDWWMWILGILMLYVFAALSLYWAGRVYKKALLASGHRVSLGLILKWFKRS